jgi:hypothetical protein
VIAAKAALGLDDDQSLVPGVPPIVLKGLDDAEAAAELLDQVPDVVKSIAGGASEFEPTPAEMRRLVQSSYYSTAPPLSPSSSSSSFPPSSSPPTGPLVLSFDDDGIDESDELSSLLEGAAVPYARKQLPGTHVTPLAIDPDATSTPLLPIPDALDSALDLRTALLKDADALVEAVDEYFTDAIAAAIDERSLEVAGTEGVGAEVEEVAAMPEVAVPEENS